MNLKNISKIEIEIWEIEGKKFKPLYIQNDPSKVDDVLTFTINLLEVHQKTFDYNDLVKLTAQIIFGIPEVSVTAKRIKQINLIQPIYPAQNQKFIKIIAALNTGREIEQVQKRYPSVFQIELNHEEIDVIPNQTPLTMFPPNSSK